MSFTVAVDLPELGCAHWEPGDLVIAKAIPNCVEAPAGAKSAAVSSTCGQVFLLGFTSHSGEIGRTIKDRDKNRPYPNLCAISLKLC